MKLDEWLRRVESYERAAAYLWPKTPVGNLQAEIWRRVGASDWNVWHPDCRALNIRATIDTLTRNELLPKSFTVLDLCCGDGVILLQIGRTFLDAQCYGIDLLRYPTHELAERRGGCAFYRVPLQRLVESAPPDIIDVGIMLNTFRGWDKAQLPPEDAQLPEKTLHWLKGNCRYVFLTVTAAQQDWLKREGWFIWDVGKGEDDSRLICGFPCEGPEGPSGVWNLEAPK